MKETFQKKSEMHSRVKSVKERDREIFCGVLLGWRLSLFLALPFRLGLLWGFSVFVLFMCNTEIIFLSTLNN